MDTTTRADMSSIKIDMIRLREMAQSRQFGLYIAIASLLAVICYVFLLTAYSEYLFSDMKGFWFRALERLDGETFRETQFMAWPPTYHILLAELLRLLHLVGLDRLVRLETPLLVHIAVFGASVYALQRLAVAWFDRAEITLVVVLLYAFGFPALYFHAFLLPDTISSSLLVIATTCIYRRSSWPWLLTAAAIFGFASCIRPSIAPYGLAFVIYLLLQYRFSRQFFARAAAFSALFFAMVGLAALENSHISSGKVTGLSANGGLDFFVANSRYHRIELRYDGWHNFMIVPALSWRPENGVFYSSTPYYNQDFYFKLGWGFITHDPTRLIKNLAHVRHLFFADMLPSRYDAAGFAVMRPIWDVFKIVMLLGIMTWAWFWPLLARSEAPLFGFMATTIVLTCVVSYLFTGEPRYTYSIIFCFYLLFFKLVEAIWKTWPARRRQIFPALLASAGFAGLVAAAPSMVEPTYPPTTTVTVTPLPAASGQPTIKREFNVGRVLFPFGKHRALEFGKRSEQQLRHADAPDLVVNDAAHISMADEFEITGDDKASLLFSVNSAWPMRLSIDGQQMLTRVTPDYFFEENLEVTLMPGKHTIRVEMDYQPRQGGFAVNYSYLDKDQWRHRAPMGVSDGRVIFKPIGEHLP